MDDIIPVLKQVLSWKEAGDKTALATVIHTWGSAPRRVGSMMCVNHKLDFQGSVSGGCVESAVIDEARQCIQSGQSKRLEFGVTNEQAWDIGLACGGRIEIWVQPVTTGIAIVLEAVVKRHAEELSSLLILPLAGQAKMTVIPVETDLPTQVFDEHDKEAVEQALRADRCVVLKAPPRRFVRPVNPDLQVFIVGAVHISQKLADLIKHLDVNVCIIDPRPVFATPQRFPNINLVHKWPAEFFREQKINHRSAVIALTHDPKFDDPALISALNSKAFYIGALGSRRTHGQRVERLKKAGIKAEQLSRIDAPIGLDIKASNPVEIAVSIVAAMIAALRQ